MATNQHIEPSQPQQPTEAPKPRIVSFRCPVEVQKELRKRAIDDDSSIEEICVTALLRYLNLVKTA